MSTQGSLATFFDSQSTSGGFQYNPSNTAHSEFNRLCEHFGWEQDDKERKLALRKFKDALTKQFNENYGVDVEDLSAWQTLCIRLNIKPLPSTLERCRQVVTSTHVNLVDLVDGYKKGDKPIHRFISVKGLSDYTIKTGKYFPRDNAYAGDLLRYLLRPIFDPSAKRREFSYDRKGIAGPSVGRRRGGD